MFVDLHIWTKWLTTITSITLGYDILITIIFVYIYIFLITESGGTEPNTPTASHLMIPKQLVWSVLCVFVLSFVQPARPGIWGWIKTIQNPWKITCNLLYLIFMRWTSMCQLFGVSSAYQDFWPIPISPIGFKSGSDVSCAGVRRETQIFLSKMTVAPK